MAIVSLAGASTMALVLPRLRETAPGTLIAVKRIDFDDTSSAKVVSNVTEDIEGLVNPLGFNLPPDSAILFRRGTDEDWRIVSPAALSGAVSRVKSATIVAAVPDTDVESWRRALVISVVGFAHTANLPLIAQYPEGVPFSLRRTDADAAVLTLATPDAALIDGAASTAIGGGAAEGRTLIHDATNWHTVGMV